MDALDAMAPVTVGLSNTRTNRRIVYQAFQRWCYGVTDYDSGTNGWTLCSVGLLDRKDPSKIRMDEQVNVGHNHAGKALLLVTVFDIDGFPFAEWVVLHTARFPLSLPGAINSPTLPAASVLAESIQNWTVGAFGEQCRNAWKAAQETTRAEQIAALARSPITNTELDAAAERILANAPEQPTRHTDSEGYFDMTGQ